MAPGRIKKWFKSLGSDSHRARQSDPRDIAPAATEAAAAVSATASSGPVYRLNSEMAQEYMKNIKRFRILVMGRANAGKTTILQRVCNSTENPEIFDGKGNKIDDTIVQGTLARGYHRIEHELIFQSNLGFVFHDSCGFEAGAAEEFDQMKDFVVDRAATPKVNERIHAIWFCIPMTENHRTVTAAEQKFFNECDTGHVPVIVLLTKVDTLNLDAIEELEDEGWEIEGAQEKIAEKEQELLKKWLAHIQHELGKCKFPPKGYVTLQKMHQESADCSAVMDYTANVLNEEGLQRLLISTQQSSIALCVQYAVDK
ncbi:GTP-binding protein [Pisolithus tinctorius]|nr:GTP-binding protein [Pisolithus tinctorius]